jgi:hypothetical protein
MTPLNIRCAYCESQPGKRCRTRWGDVIQRRFHRARCRAAENPQPTKGEPA